LDADLELGGTDQTFNMLVGRDLLAKMKNKEKYVMSVPMITGTDGAQMSKSSGNCIWLGDPPSQMYGKLMSIADSQIEPYMRLLTDLASGEIEKLLDNPFRAKHALAHEIVRMYHSKVAADKAGLNFTKTFQDKEPNFSTKIPLDTTLARTVSPFTKDKSISSAKRLIAQGGVSINGKSITDPFQKVAVGDKIKIGTTTFGVVVDEN
jgi:tyrosyl-tRNA synthetase